MWGWELHPNAREGLPAGTAHGFAPPDQARRIDFTICGSKECKEVSATSARREAIKLANKINLSGTGVVVLSLVLVLPVGSSHLLLQSAQVPPRSEAGQEQREVKARTELKTVIYDEDWKLMATVEGESVKLERGYTLDQVVLKLLDYMERKSRANFERCEEEKKEIFEGWKKSLSNIERAGQREE